MKIVYIVLAHRYPEQLVRLINRLDTGSATFFIHIDQKADSGVYTFLLNEFKAKSNVFFTKRFTCYWAGFGIVQATYQCLKEVIEKGIDFDYISLMSGQDYPIKSNDYIQSFFIKNKGKSFINFNPFPFDEWADHNGGWDRVNYWHFIRPNNQYMFPPRPSSRFNYYINLIWRRTNAIIRLNRKFPNGLHPFGGAQFWCLYKTHAQYVYDFVQKNPDYFQFFKYVFVPDEILFQTIIGNSNFTADVVNETLHFLEWYRPGAVLNVTDIENLKKAEHLFARKFDQHIDAKVLDIIDEEILRIEQTS